MLCLFDGNGLVHRAYHSQGDTLTNFCRYVWEITSEFLPGLGHHITRAAVVFDPEVKRNWRHEIDPLYKANRGPTPLDLKDALKECHAVCEWLGLRALYAPDGFEADDLIATYVRIGVYLNDRVVIVSCDKDLMQLIRPGVVMLDHMNMKLFDEDRVQAKFGVPPHRLQDYLALVGDAADNVPGVRGIGPKKAADLINYYGSLYNVLQSADRIRVKVIRDTLTKHRGAALRAYELVELRDCRGQAPASLFGLDYFGTNADDLIAMLERAGARSLADRVRHAYGKVAA